MAQYAVGLRYLRSKKKRALDLALCIPALPVFLLSGPVIVLALKFFSPGPVFYVQERLGQGGQPFSLLKYRTMREGAENGLGEVLSPGSHDPRLTRLGQFMRPLHIDELPQVLNVLAGRMSLVGPRPERPGLHAGFVQTVPGWVDRLAVKPGMTGLAQVRGHGAEVAAVKLADDLEYIRTASVGTDLRLLWATVWPF
jgi:lipopolysaccharide/colanic/teichoic acid biosynthesis glycosyltransferase